MVESEMSDRIIGILGGMGPAATADLYLEIIRLTPAERDQEHLPVLIYSNPKVPDRTKAILEGAEDPLPVMLESARVLERGGAGVLAIPCNAAHYFLPQLQEQVSTRILNMLEETLLCFQTQQPQGRSIGLLATTGTVHSGIYRSVFTARGIDLLIPNDADQERVHSGIQTVKAGAHDQKTQEMFHSVGASLVQAGAQAVILGCTEIPLSFNPEAVDFLVLNPTRILAQAAVDWALGKRE
jgi:aspartate racemase